METGDDLHLAREDAENQTIGKAAIPDAADVQTDARKLVRIVAQALQKALELVKEAGGQSPSRMPPYHASASKASRPSPGSASNMASRRSNSAACRLVIRR